MCTLSEMFDLEQFEGSLILSNLKEAYCPFKDVFPDNQFSKFADL